MNDESATAIRAAGFSDCVGGRVFAAVLADRDDALRHQRAFDACERPLGMRVAAQEEVDRREAALGPGVDRDVGFRQQHDARHAGVGRIAEAMEVLEKTPRARILGGRAQHPFEAGHVGEPPGIHAVAVDQPVRPARGVPRAARDFGEDGGSHRYLWPLPDELQPPPGLPM